jgi:hypothetical protein
VGGHSPSSFPSDGHSTRESATFARKCFSGLHLHFPSFLMPMFTGGERTGRTQNWPTSGPSCTGQTREKEREGETERERERKRERERERETSVQNERDSFKWNFLVQSPFVVPQLSSRSLNGSVCQCLSTQGFHSQTFKVTYFYSRYFTLTFDGITIFCRNLPRCGIHLVYPAL